MPEPSLDVLCIGNAIVDVIAEASDNFLRDEGLVKGTMRLVDAEEAERLYSHMGPAHQVSGGSAGNTASGIAALGARSGFIGQVAPDQLGEFYRHDLSAAGVEFITPAADVGAPTARSMILVTPDGHRTMNTFLGAAQHLPASALDEEQIRGSAILYLEGYLWDPETPRYAMIRAIEVAREAGRKVAFTLSDIFCVDRHRDGFNKLLDGGRIDILFANQAEVEALTGVPHLESAVAAVKDKVETLVVTRSEDGALATRGGKRADILAEPIDKLVDTTGAGDLFASGFLVGEARGFGLERSLRLGAICAAEVIQHYGARPETDLRALAGTSI
ncbi:MAG TPA: adenosine kinase [Sphingomicrobium sp.]|jgi:sugar/nucleoside kinase (ribokinase family)|nr:adenosine kinase [Sphingomicrobium sp.]